MDTNTENVEQTKLKEVNISTGTIDMPSIDMTPYIGKKAKIATAKVVESPFIDERTGKQKMSLYIETESVAVIGEGEKAINLKGTKFFPLYYSDKGDLGWGEKTTTGVFLAKHNSKQIKNLIGKEVTIQIRTSKKDNRDYLTIV